MTTTQGPGGIPEGMLALGIFDSSIAPSTGEPIRDVEIHVRALTAADGSVPAMGTHETHPHMLAEFVQSWQMNG